MVVSCCFSPLRTDVIFVLSFFTCSLLINSLGFGAIPMVVGLVFGCFGIVTVVGFFILSTVAPDNCCSRFCMSKTPLTAHINYDQEDDDQDDFEMLKKNVQTDDYMDAEAKNDQEDYE